VWKKHCAITRVEVASGQQAWKNVDLGLKETRVTLAALKDLVKGIVKITLWNQELREGVRKAALVIKLRKRRTEIEEFRKRVEKNNSDIAARMTTVLL
jgi:hypothetical protein